MANKPLNLSVCKISLQVIYNLVVTYLSTLSPNNF